MGIDSSVLQVVIFDLDQTLINRTATFQRFLEKQYHRFQDQLGTATVVEFVATALEQDNNGYTSKEIVY